MVAGQQERWNAELVQAAHCFCELAIGRHVAPSPNRFEAITTK